MATNLDIDPVLLDRAVQVSDERTKKAVVTKALQEFIARRHQKGLVRAQFAQRWALGGERGLPHTGRAQQGVG